MIMGRIKEFGYKNMWLAWIHNSLAWLLVSLFIYRSNLNWQIDVDLMQQLREKSGLREAPWLSAAAKSPQVWLEDISLHFLEFL